MDCSKANRSKQSKSPGAVPKILIIKMLAYTIATCTNNSTPRHLLKIRSTNISRKVLSLSKSGNKQTNKKKQKKVETNTCLSNGQWIKKRKRRET